MEKKEIVKNTKTDEPVKFKGKFISAIGKRKSSVAQVRLYKNGKGIIIINQQKLSHYFPEHSFKIIVNQPLKLTNHLKDLDFSIIIKGGGKRGQADAIRHGITRALEKFDKKLRTALKAKGWLTRDARINERKKPGLKKARRAPQRRKR